ncbi:MAG: hypothetical protein AAF502_07945 [Bacteroidota bacterium]
MKLLNLDSKYPIWKILDRYYAPYDLDSLIIMAWQAKLNPNSFRMNWINTAFQSYLTNNSISDDENNIVKRVKQNKIELNDFFNKICGDELDQLGDRLNNMLRLVYEKYSKFGPNKFAEEINKENYNQSQKIKIGLIRSQINKQQLVIGIRTISKNGIELKCNSFEASTKINFATYYDIFCVFQFKRNRIKAVQGVLIPVDDRKQINDERFTQAEKAAKAAIMGRNMSHNIGSHVIFYLKEHLNTIPAIIENGVLDHLELKVVNDHKSEADCNTSNLTKMVVFDPNLGDFSSYSSINAMVFEKMELPFLKGLGRFLTYLQERQDFIATVSTDHIPFFSTVNFKEFVFDELTSDKKIIRHKKDSEENRFDLNLKREKNILLSFIAKSENIDRDSLLIKIDGHDPEIEISKNAPVRKYEVDLPGGLIGRQAFFSVLENIIRNAAKHGKWKEQNLNQLIFDIRLNDDLKEYPNLIRVEIVDNIKITDKKVKEISSNLTNPLIDDETLELNEAFKGLKEMRISAAWLRGASSLRNIDTGPPFISVKKDKENGTLSYIFYLVKPSKLAIVSDDLYNKYIRHQDTSKGNFNDILSLGRWEIFSANEYLTRKTNYRLTVVSASETPLNTVNTIRLNSRRTSILKREKIDTLDEFFNNVCEDLDSFEDSPEDLIKTLDKQYIETYLEYLKNTFNWIKPSDKPLLVIEDAKHQTPLRKYMIHPEVHESYLNFTHNQKVIEINSESLGKYGVKNQKFVAFKKHLGTIKNYESFVNHFTKTYIDDKFFSVEGITGNNSSSRIIRNDLKDDHWILKILESGVIKVLLIDERLFKKYAYENTLDNQEIDQSHLEAKLLKLKGIQVCNLSDDLNFLIDLNGEKIAHLDFNEKNPTIKQIADSPKLNTFHIVSIHQGLLDKVEEKKWPKNEDSSKTERFEKVIGFFKKNFSPPLKFIVHSGRSKPPFLPGNIPFLPFSGLEVAVKDAKLTLTEQLLSAKI